MSVTKFLLLTTVATQFFLSSCKKSSEVPADAANAGVDYQLKATNTTSVINAKVEAGNIQWTSGYVSATQIKFEATKASGQVEFKSKTNQHINLFAPVLGPFGNIKIPAGTYGEVEFKIQLEKNVNDAALELTGAFGSSTGNIPVVLRVIDNIEIKAEKENVTITATDINTALTSIDLSKLTAGITQSMLANAKVTSDGIVISSSSNTNLYTIILANLSKSHESEFEHHH